MLTHTTYIKHTHTQPCTRKNTFLETKAET